jgi:hypothetical protein
MIEASSKSLKDSNVSPKVKIMKGVEVCFLIPSISKVRNACWSSEMGTKMSDKWVNYSHGPAQSKQQVGNV